MSDEVKVPNTGEVPGADSSADNTNTPPPNSQALDEQREGSRLGRKVARMENDFQSFMSEMREFMRGSSSSTSKEVVTSAELPEVISTADDVVKVFNHLKNEEARKDSSYQNEYRTELNRLAVGESNHAEIVDEMMKNHNWRHSNFGRTDAQLNYEKAKNAILQRKLSGTRPAVNGGGASALPTSFGVNTSSASSARPSVQLDEKAARFARSMGLTDEQIRKSLEK